MARRGSGPRGGEERVAERQGLRPDWIGRRLLFVIVGLGVASVTASGQLSGQFGLDLVARRIPTTLSGEIALDTPSEFAMLEFGIAANLDLKVDCGFADLVLDAATNMAGPEHAVGVADVHFEPIPLSGAIVENLHLIGEMWCAVPFAAVTDVNNLPNSVVIPPGDPLFVTARFATSFEIAGFSAKCLLMLQDINFPNPSSPAAVQSPSLFYRAGDQEFDVGSLLTVSLSSPFGGSLSLAVGLNASQDATVVKGYSAAGRVDPGNCFLTGSVGGIPLCDVALGPFTLTDAQFGIGFSVSTTQTLSATASFSAGVGDGVSVSTSFTLFKGHDGYTGLNMTGAVGCFQYGVLLDELELTSLSAGSSIPFSMGALKGTFGVSATGLQRGLTGLSARLSLSQGLFSAGTNVAFAQRGADFGFASLGTQLAFRIPPGTISIQATFSRYGLTRASVSTGVTF
jgi:hypothetical protein